MNKEITVEIPKYFLLTIAVHGNMGDGNLPDLMRTWAQRICREKGLQKEVENLQDEKIKTLRKNLKNILGEEMVEGIDREIEEVFKTLQR